MSFSLSNPDTSFYKFSLADLKEQKINAQNGQKLKDEEALKKACQDFESYFLQQLFKEMRKTVPKSTFFGKREEEEIFLEMLDGERATAFAKLGGIGLGRLLYDNLKEHILKG